VIDGTLAPRASGASRRGHTFGSPGTNGVVDQGLIVERTCGGRLRAAVAEGWGACGARLRHLGGEPEVPQDALRHS
jgi:hypothetical protein